MSNFNSTQHQQQQQQQMINQNGNPLMSGQVTNLGYVQNPNPVSTPPQAGAQNTGNFGPGQQHQQQIGNPRTPGGGMVSMQPGAYGQMGMASQQQQQHSQQNSPAASGLTSEPGVPPASMQNQGGTATQPPHQQQVQHQKEMNPASFCRLGQETIQELVNKTNEMFGCLKATQPPDGRQQFGGVGVERKQKLHDMLKAVKVLSKRLRIIYEKVEEAFPSNDTMDMDVQNLIPYASDENGRMSVEDRNELQKRKNTEVYRLALEEYKEVADQVTARNRHMKETIDHLRQIIWDVNTMLAMRKDEKPTKERM